MDQLGVRLISFLSTDSKVSLRDGLCQKLGYIDKDLYVYYIVPLSNLIKILQDGGIRCRSKVTTNIEDLSAHNVQARRTNNIMLAHNVRSSYNTRNKEIHECVNFFWNPINDTLRAFQRHSLLRDSEENDYAYGIVCILELRLKDFFYSGNVYWTTSKVNLASNVFTTFSSKIYEEFDWGKIFDVDANYDKSANQHRSAEFIAFIDHSGHLSSDLIPISFVKRILVSHEYEMPTKNLLIDLSSLVFPIKNDGVFLDRHELLNAEKNFINTIFHLNNYGLSFEILCDTINSFANLEEYLNCTITQDCFTAKEVAYNVHGVGHVTRVMFWTYFLSRVCGTNQADTMTALYAAFIHDLGRENNNEDEIHGLASARRYENFLKGKHLPNHLHESCMRAIAEHCIDDSNCIQQDLTWRLLKDADALDRGRFAPPKDNVTSQTHIGCITDYLRMNIFKNSPDIGRNIAWLAYWIALMTRYTRWSSNTYLDIKQTIINGIRASLKNGILPINQLEITNAILTRLINSQ